MQDDQLLQDLAKNQSPFYVSVTEALTQHGITRYSEMFALLRNESAEPALRCSACVAIVHLKNDIVKQKAIYPLLSALKSSHEEVRYQAAVALGWLEHRRAVLPLIALAEDRTQTEPIRRATAIALSYLGDKRALPNLKHVMLGEEGLDNYTRSPVIYHTSFWADGSMFETYLKLLDDLDPDIRFDAATGLNWLKADVRPAQPKLDELVAFDHERSTHGWQVSREALMQAEQIAYGLLTKRNFKRGLRWFVLTWIITPAPEYQTLQKDYQTGDDIDEIVFITPESVTFRVKVEWLRERLLEQWLGIALNVREPPPQSYLLDWMLTLPDSLMGRPLIGGLHRDSFSVVLTGDAEDVYAFAAWYRSIIEPEQTLFLYEYAEFGVELKPGMTGEAVG